MSERVSLDEIGRELGELIRMKRKIPRDNLRLGVQYIHLLLARDHPELYERMFPRRKRRGRKAE